MRTSIMLAISALLIFASSGGVLEAQTRAGTSAASLAADEARTDGNRESWSRNVALHRAAEDESMAAPAVR